MTYGWEYFKPENHGLTGVGSVDWYGDTGCYEWFQTTVMYHRETGVYYWETSAGCSCDGPMEVVSCLDDLSSGTFFDLADHLGKQLDGIRNDNYLSDQTKAAIAADVVDVLSAAQKVRTVDEC
jgi:hypothetical protein